MEAVPDPLTLAGIIKLQASADGALYDRLTALLKPFNCVIVIAVVIGVRTALIG